MALVKLGEARVIKPEDIQDVNSIISDADLKINDRMKKFADNLKTIAPQASDFLYFTAVMMHAAEAALLDDDGNIKKDASGNHLTASWENVGDGSIKWTCSDPTIKPYKNSNNDIFPESELKKAYHKWVGRPLCLDHKSSSVDMIRGVIVDTYWDESRKRIIALCALDKKNYPDLARKVTSGYATNVSMGTAVGRAVCTEDGCHRVAQVESDFCEHMKRRSCYGEINLDLSPIELSLVVTGADPKAKVKHIIAKDLSEARKAASALQDYLDGKIALASVEEDSEIEHIKKELDKLNDKVNKLVSSLEEANGGESDDKNEAYGMTHSTDMSQEVESTNIETPLSAPEDNISYANAVTDAREKLSSINETLNKLSKLSSLHNSEGSTMTEKKAYWQGTEPGDTEYPVDPLQEKARMQDKHMVGQSPFPEVGPVDGMHPGVESHEGTEEERKRRLQRLAEAERREKIRRAAVEQAKRELESRGYHQGTEEPKEGVQYQPDPLQEQARKDDKHMVGKEPFPGVGSVDGLYGDDLATKEKLSRASLKATFKKAADQSGKLNKAASSWNVYAGDHLILTASVDEITRGNSDTVYDAVATKDFGRAIIKKIATDGFEAARVRFKGAQDVPAPAAGGAPAGTPMNEGEPMGGAPADLGDDMGLEGMEGMEDMGDEAEGASVEEAITSAKEALDKALDLLQEGADVIDEEASELETVAAAPTDEAGFSKSSVASMRRTVSSMLNEGFGQVTSTIKAHKAELDTAKTVLDTKFASMNGKQKAYFVSLVNDAVSASKKTLADSGEIMDAFVRYAQGTHALLEKKAQVPNRPEFDNLLDIEEEEDRVPENYQGDVWKKHMLDKEEEQSVKPGEVVERAMPADDGEDSKDENDADVSVKPEDIDKLPGDTKVVIEADDKIDMTTKEGRAMYRAKLAQKGVQFSDMLGKAHPEGGKAPGDIDAPAGDLAKVERIDEVSKAMNELANLPPRVRKQAEEIYQMVSEGKIAKDEVDELVALGVDKDAVSYYKQYWAEAKDSESNEFANLLTQEKMKATAAAELETQTVRMRRAHDLAYEMRDKGMISTAQIPQQVDEILSWNDEGFNSVKNIVAKQDSLSKTASVPQVGMLHSEELYLPSASNVEQGSSSNELRSFLEARFSGKRL